MAATLRGRPFAVFDIDGTVVRWQLYHAISDALANKGIINTQAFKQVRAARMNWKQRRGDESFHDYEQTLVRVFEQALKDLRVQDLTAAADEVFDEYKDQVYAYTRDLIRELKAKQYLLFAISGSPDIIVKKLAHYYGFDDFAASIYESKNGYYTGTIQLSFGNTKPKLLQDLIDKYDATVEGSMAIADSEGDIGMLNMVEQPIAFNPSKQLIQVATKERWPIVVERKNVVYTLNYRSGEYQLTL